MYLSYVTDTSYYGIHISVFIINDSSDENIKSRLEIIFDQNIKQLAFINQYEIQRKTICPQLKMVKRST